MKVKLTKAEIPHYMIGAYFRAAQQMVEDLAPTAIAEKIGVTLVISGDDEAEVRRFVDHVKAMSSFLLKEEIL